MDKNTFYKNIIFSFGLILFLIFLWKIQIFLKPFIIAFFIGIFLNPTINRLENKGLPRWLSLAIIVFLVLLLFIIALIFLIPVVSQQLQGLMDNIPLYEETIRTWVNNNIFLKFPSLNKNPFELISQDDIRGYLSRIFPMAASFFVSITSVVFNAVLVFFILIFGLANPKILKDTLIASIPSIYKDKAIHIGRDLTLQLRKWVQGLFLQMITVGILSYIGLLIIGVNYSVIFGIIAGLLEVVPYLGPVISAILPALVAFSQEPTKAIFVLALFFLIQQMESNILVPFIMSRQLGLHPIGIIFFVLIMTNFLGLFGTFIAVPTFVAVKILYKELYIRRIGQLNG